MSKREFANAYKTVRRFIVVAYLSVVLVPWRYVATILTCHF